MTYTEFQTKIDDIDRKIDYAELHNELIIAFLIEMRESLVKHWQERAES